MILVDTAQRNRGVCGTCNRKIPQHIIEEENEILLNTKLRKWFFIAGSSLSIIAIVLAIYSGFNWYVKGFQVKQLMLLLLALFVLYCGMGILVNRSYMIKKRMLSVDRKFVDPRN